MRIFTGLLVTLALLLAGGARAQSQAVALTYGTAGGTLTGGAITTSAPSDFTRLIQGGTAVGDVAIRDGVKARVGSVDVNMVLERRMPWLQVSRAAAAIGRTLPYVATAVAFIDLMDSLRVRSDGSGWRQDPGTDRVSATVWTAASKSPSNNPATFTSNSALAVAQAVVAHANAEYSALPVIQANSTTRIAYQITTCDGGCVSTSYNVIRLNRAQCTDPLVNNVRQACTPSNFLAQGDSVGTNGVTQLTCPASVDALNPANSIPAGLPVGYDGKCRTGRYTEPRSETQAGDIAFTNGAKATAAAVVGSILGRGVDLAPRTDLPTASGPGTVAQPGTTTTTTGPSGTATGTTTPTSVIVYNGPSYTWNDSTVVTTTNGGGTTTTTTNAPPPAEVQTCGLPGKPACKIDETGTPTMPPVVDPTVGQIADDAARRTAADAQLTDPAFGWFSAPPVVTCTPFEWPGGFSLDPCGPMEIVRSIMAYLWAIFAAWWSFGIVRRTVAGA